MLKNRLHSALAFTDSRVNQWFTDLYLFSFGGEDHGDVIFTITGASHGAGGRIASAPFFYGVYLSRTRMSGPRK
jgi:hypothetical protein